MSQNPAQSEQDNNGACKTPVVIEGADAINEILGNLALSAEWEVLTFAPGGAHTSKEIKDGQGRTKGALARGVPSRTIYLDSVRNDSATLAHVSWLNQHGSEVRTVPKLPIRLIIVDRKIAVLPTNLSGAMASVTLYDNPSIIAVLVDLFEMYWRFAQPIGMVRSPDGLRLSESDRVLLEMMCLGKTNTEIAKRLGVSPTTIKRNIQELEKRLGAQSRSQATYLAGKLGIY